MSGRPIKRTLRGQYPIGRIITDRKQVIQP